jgi:protein subunit release factor A
VSAEVELKAASYPLRVYELERRKAVAERSELRSLANGTGDRTDKIRTYNFPQVQC